MIGGYIDYALRDLTGLCSEQLILRPGFPGECPHIVSVFVTIICVIEGYNTSMAADVDSGDLWEKLVMYQLSGSMMGCSIQPLPKKKGRGGVEVEVGQG